MSFLPNLSNQELTKSFSSTRIQSILIHAYTRMKLGLKLLLWTSGKCQRGEFVYVLWNVPI